MSKVITTLLRKDDTPSNIEPMTSVVDHETYREQEARAADTRQKPIIERLRSGMKQADIARDLEVSPTWVNKVAKRAIRRGLWVPPPDDASDAGE